MLVGSPWVSAQVPSTAHCTRRQWAAPPGCRRQRQAAAAAAAGTHSRAASAAAASCPPATSLSAAAGPRSHAALTQAAASKPVTASVAAAAAAAAAGSSGGSGTGSAGAPATARLYRATCPLVGFEALEAALGPALPPQLALHHFVVVEPLCGGSGGGGSSSSALGTSSSAQAGQAVAVAFDFLPADPLSPLTAAALLSGGSVPGVLRRRPLSGVPRLRCECVGASALPDPLGAAEAFQAGYDKQLRLLANDCTHHADRLLAHLLGRAEG